jgi:GH15 family glucan-1,4-alpha-glucosidase
LVHYKASRYFLVNGFSQTLDRLSQFAVGNKGTGGKEGTFRDAEDGKLSGNPIAQGSVDSVVSLRIDVEGKSSPYASIDLSNSKPKVVMLFVCSVGT